MVIETEEEYRAALARAHELTDDPFRLEEEHEFQVLLRAIEAWEAKLLEGHKRSGPAHVPGLDP